MGVARKRSTPLLQASSAASGALQGFHVLVVDDHEDARELVALVLEGAGARVTQAESVRVAMSAIAGDDFSVLVSDIGMPMEDGYDLIRRLRVDADSHRRRPLPAVAVTAFTQPEDRKKALAAGFQEHIAKPFDGPALVEVVARLAAASAEA
jgi:CheY-like chemotaxis protein